MNALRGPCLAFQSDAFVAASAELHLANCHNIGEIPEVANVYGGGGGEYDLMRISALHAWHAEAAAEDDGGAMNVRGSLTVMGSLTIRDCGAKYGNGGSLGSNYGSLSPGIDHGRPPKSWFVGLL